VSDLAHIPNSSQPPDNPSLRKIVIDTTRAEFPAELSEDQKVRLMATLAERLGNLQEWERYVGKHEGIGYCLQALPDGRIVSGGTDKKIRIWTQETSGQWHQEILEGHEGTVRSLQVLSTGQIVSGSCDKTIRICDGSPVSDGGAL